jgi:hypothetical protein
MALSLMGICRLAKSASTREMTGDMYAYMYIVCLSTYRTNDNANRVSDGVCKVNRPTAISRGEF